MAAKQPLMMTFQQLSAVLTPYTKGKKRLVDNIKEIWKISTPAPQLYQDQIIKIIEPKYLEEFARLCLE